MPNLRKIVNIGIKIRQEKEKEGLNLKI